MKTVDQRVTPPLIPSVKDVTTVTSSKFPAYRGINMECIRGETPPNPLLRPEWEWGWVQGFQMTGALQGVQALLLLFESKLNSLLIALFNAVAFF